MSVGKNFSCNNASGKRNKSDFYQTPYCLTRLLLDEVCIDGSILEPASGNGAIVKILIEYGYDVVYYDLIHGTDFLANENRHFDTIITNPPYSLAFEFIQKAKQVAGEFYFLPPLSYLHGKQRYDSVWSDVEYPLYRIFVFTRSPLLGSTIRSDGKHDTGMMVYAWFHFKRNVAFKNKAPKIYWLDNNSFVVSKSDQDNMQCSGFFA